MKYIHLILVFFVLSCSEKSNKDNYKVRVYSNQKPDKKSIIDRETKFEGPDKYMYLFELKKHGGVS